MSFFVRLASPVLLLAGVAAPLAAQQPAADSARAAAMAALPAGATLRIRARSLEGATFRVRLVERVAEGLLVEVARDTVLVRDAEIMALERRTGVRSRLAATAIGAGKGFLAGAAVGGVATAITHIEERKRGCPDCMITSTMVVAVLGVAVTGASTVVGGVVGHSRREQWRREWPPAR